MAASLAVPQVRADMLAEVAASEAAGTPEAAVAAEVIANCFRVATHTSGLSRSAATRLRIRNRIRLLYAADVAASNDKATAIGPVGNSRLPFKTSRVRRLPLQVEDIDDAISGACNFVVPVSILERIGHVEFPPDPLPVEGCEPRR